MTMACNSEAVSAPAPLTALLFNALLMAAKLLLLTPLTPAARYCAKLGLVSVAELFCAAVWMASMAAK